MKKLLALLLLAAACATPPPPRPAEAAPAPAAQAAPAAAPAPTAPAPATPGIDASLVDRRVNPCQDFYAFACGGWLDRTEIPADRPAWGRFQELDERNKLRLREILEAEVAGQGDPQDLFATKVGDFYAACMDEAGAEKRGLADLRAEWRTLAGLTRPAQIAGAVGRLHAVGIPALWWFGSGQDNKDSTRVVAWIRQGGLTLPDRDYYLGGGERNAEIRRGYLAHVEKMLTMAGERPARARAHARGILDLEKAMAESQWTRVEMRDPVRTYHPYDLAGLEKAAPRFGWKAYLTALDASGVGAFAATTPQSLARIDQLLHTTPIDSWRAYLRWNVLRVMARARALPRAFVEESFAFGARYFTGAKALQPRWRHCVETTDGALGEALGQAFVRRFFPGDAREKALALVVGVQKAQAANLESLPWMDGPTRDRAQDKLARIDNKIGYPSRWRDYSSLEVTRTSFFRDLLAADAFERRRDLAKIGKPVDRTEWEMTPPTVNAYYEPPMNEMVFPAGILQPPFYTRGANDAVNYGAVGFVVGHELTHGFDDQGRKYDAAGNQVDWWSPAVASEFERRAACVEKQYQGYTVLDGLHLNGTLTLGENIADLGGLKLAFAAYRASRQGKPAEAPVDGFTPEQQFFLAAAQVWCGKYRPETMRLRVQVDPHSPPRWRVDGPLSNLPEFADAFQCRSGDPMVRADRCQVW
ncbi:MAG TPA: M13 family metallopeptidase [Anaeromyxobacteraceae bacterium]|nr:M13 family metallopeptidase [Anaeromyxobacteraceae bacterium]